MLLLNIFSIFILFYCAIFEKNIVNGDEEFEQREEIPFYGEQNYTLDAVYYSLPIPSNAEQNYGGGRPGKATHTHDCGNIRPVPAYLRSTSQMGRLGLGQFYQKYTHAYNIPVLGSRQIPDDALKRACYIVRFLLADNRRARESYYRLYGRFSLMGAREYTTQIPEYADLPSSWNQRARGLGATKYRPTSSGAEENVLCYTNDRYREEDIALHEFAHGLHLLGLSYAHSGFDANIKRLYQYAKSRGTWRNTYAMSTDHEYFAEGVQSYFHVNAHRDTPDGIHGSISTRARLQQYDPSLYNVVKKVFSCGNEYIKRCGSTRAREQAQRLKLDCQDGGGFLEGDDDDDDDDDDGTDEKECKDQSTCCSDMVSKGFCNKYEDFMTDQCKDSCQKCPATTTTTTANPNCRDNNSNCASWAGRNECSKNPAYMHVNCKKSCNRC